MTCGIYGLFAAETGECLYIGQSAAIEERWRYHLKALRRGKHLREGFNAWFRAHEEKAEAISFVILEECLNANATKNELEIKWFLIHKPRFYGKLPNKNEKWQHSEETKRKISAGVTARKPPKNPKHPCEGCTGRTLAPPLCRSCLLKEKRSANLTKVLALEEVILRGYSQGKSIRALSDELKVPKLAVRELLSRNAVEVKPRMTGRKPTAETRRKISEALTGKRHLSNKLPCEDEELVI